MKKLILVLLPLALTACFEESSSQTAAYSGAAISLVSSDYTSSDIALVDESYELTDSIFPQSYSDITISKGHNSLYLINRFNKNSIIKFNNETIGDPVWEYSTQGSIENQQSNPYFLIENTETSAYVGRYGSGEVWHVNPSAELEIDFNLGAIDLSSFDADGVPEMAGGVIYQGILYIILQRQTYFTANELGLLVGIDTNTNTLIDLDPNSESNALTLKTANPNGLQLIGNTLYITSWGKNAVKDYSDYPTVSISEAPAYNGGVEAVNLNTLTSSLSVDDGDQLQPYGQIYGSSIYNNRFVLRGYNVYTSTSNIYIKEGSSIPTALDDTLEGRDIHFAQFDVEGNIWVGIGGSSDHHVRVYSLNQNNEYTTIQNLPTNLMPTRIVFK